MERYDELNVGPQEDQTFFQVDKVGNTRKPIFCHSFIASFLVDLCALGAFK